MKTTKVTQPYFVVGLAYQGKDIYHVLDSL
jgi:hypothetical protein